eukprot:COSAG04_NODE_27521_length_282_cov_0.841530_2_plen_45_part_01
MNPQGGRTEVGHIVEGEDAHVAFARNDIAAVLRRMQPRWQRYRGG